MLAWRSERRLGTRVEACLALLLTSCVAWSSLGGQSAKVPLLVTNATCITGTCQPVRVLAFPQNQPRTPGGLWSIELGTLSTASACFAIPPESKFLIVDATTHDTVVVRWTSRDSLALGTLAPGEPSLPAQPSTGYFVPQHKRGWSIALPGKLNPHPARPCKPTGSP